MSDKIDNLVLEHLKAIRADTGNLSADMRDVKERLTELERGMAMVLSGPGRWIRLTGSPTVHN